jgi:hypothetical protein
VGACVPELIKDVVPAAFLTRHVACMGSFSADGCEPGQLCIPPPDDPFHASVCVWQEGDVACPEGSAYAERMLLHRDIDDVRGCAPCSCTVPPVRGAGATATLSTMVSCSVAAAMLAPGDCAGGIGGPSILAVHYDEGIPPGACQPAVAMPIGDAAGIDPVTLCCTR